MEAPLPRRAVITFSRARCAFELLRGLGCLTIAMEVDLLKVRASWEGPIAGCGKT